MRTFDFSPFYRTIVGFDRLADMIDAAAKTEPAGGYPPYNIEQLSDNAYRIELAVAGFGEADLNVELHQNVLTITGRRAAADDNGGRTFLHRGLAERAFERRFHLADHVEVKGAALENGILSIDLEREVPEAEKPRTIAIGANAETARKVIEGGRSGSKAA